MRLPSRRRTTPRLSSPASLTAAGLKIKRSEGDVFRRLIQPWQARSLTYYDLLGEIKYAAQFYSRALSQLRLYPGEIDENGDVVESTNPVAHQMLERIQDPGGGRSNLLASFGRLMFLTGEAILFVTKDENTGLEKWEMLSTDELRIIGGGVFMRYKAPSMLAETFQSPDDEDGWEPLSENEGIAYRIWQRHPRYCADEQTEIMTENGWVRHDALRPGMRVLTLNHETGMSEWQAVSAVNRFAVEDEEMVSIEGSQHSSLTTPEHRWPVLHEGRRPARLERSWTTSGHLNSNDRVVTGAPCADIPTEATFSDDFVEAVAWFYTEGNIARRYRSAQVSICQSGSANPANVDRIRRSLGVLYGPATPERMSTGAGPLAPPRWREYEEPNRPMIYFWLNTAASAELLDVAPDKVVSLDFVRTLTREQLELFIHVSLLADGSRSQHGTGILAQKDPRRTEAFELACVLTGRSPRTRHTGRFGMTNVAARTHGTCHIQAQSRRIGPRGLNMVPKRTRYTGVVWCPTTKNRTWLARRHGTVYYTGNSYLADSTMQGVLDLCEELILLTHAVRARARSRLAGNGILFIDEQISPAPVGPVADDDPMEDRFLLDLTTAMAAPMVDEGSPSAVVPIIARVPSALLAGGERKLADLVYHLKLVDPNELYPETGLRAECIKRIALGLDMPPEILLGLQDSNHWSAWQVDETSWKAHLQPKAQQLVEDLTAAYYRPSLRDANVTDWQRHVIAYDATAVINHPDRTKDAKDLYAARAIGKASLRDAAGFDDDDAPNEEELNEMIGVAIRDGSYVKYGIPTIKAGGIEPEAGVVENPQGEEGGPVGNTEVVKGPPTPPAEQNGNQPGTPVAR